MKPKVLYAEDEPFLARIVSDGLISSGYEVRLAADGEKALTSFREMIPDICVLDIMIPVTDGYTLAAQIRKLNADVPIIFLSAKSLTDDVIKGFKSGGNDYLKKPFSMEELLVRMESLLSRFGSKGSVEVDAAMPHYQFGNCKLDTVNQRLKTPAGEFALSYKETALLEMLLLNRNAVLERQAALMKIWGNDSYYNTRSMDVFMAHLRKLLKSETDVQIMSIRSVGYKLVC